ncbi:MAG: TonB-dependent receptor [Methylococcaceae bacterium]|nr:TonB-dependent receptor [Methylococcaceae bacterium]MDZ4156292.1 TonB-dependent receptor [Methylococcales bacterium]MDP2393396.1 TonB-dependent receptor [Methylococcaceae bacterium]MDP3019897.1 TonB-dependent receptor [Methylococcaceae bacterium]MDP3388710.1 TonB-dependent receptor [Methylococcaceae bacterium]
MPVQTPIKLGLPFSKFPLPGSLLLIALAASNAAEGGEPLSNQAVSQQADYQIRSQTLDKALVDFSLKSGLQIIADGKLTSGITSPGVSGHYSQEQALQKLLAGTGVTVQTSRNGTVTLEKATAVTPQSGETTLKAMTVVGDAVQDPNDPYNKDYAVTNSSSATKTDTAIIDTPTSIQVVPRAVIDDQKASTVTDTLENVSGVRTQPALGLLSNVIVRGFSVQNVYRNGLKSNDNFPFQFDTANVQSVEVVKGPAQLYGRTEPGGLVNITTKKPLDIPYYSLEQRFGSYDLYRTEWDATGPLNKDKTLLYRFTGSYQSNNSFRDFVANDRKLFAPSITWKPTDSTDATLDLQVVDQDFSADFGLPVINKRPAPIPISRSLGDSNTPASHLNQVQLGSLLNHRFNDDWAIHSRFLASFDDVKQTFVTPTPAFNPGAALDQTTGIMQRNVSYEEDYGDKYATNLDMTGKFDLGFSKHEVLLGFDFYRSFHNYGLKGFYNTPDPALAIDIYNPSYGIPQSVFDTAFLTSQRPLRDRSVFFNQWEGVYFQDQITLWDKLHIMGGGRYDWAETGRGRSATYEQANALVDSVTRKDDGFSPRVGILYQPIHELGIYGNWTTSFGANNGVSATGGNFDPQIGEQFEAGIKTSLFDERFLSTLAYYHVTKDNLLTPDLSTADPDDSIAVGQERSQGIELDMTGQITDALSLIGSFAYTDARVTKDNSGLQGKQLSNVPDHAGSLWVKYDFSGHKTLNGFSVGLGTVAAGQRQGDIDNTFQLPGYTRVDAFAAYRWNIKKTKVTAQFNIRNLLDKQYYESTDPNNYVAPALGVAPGAPLSAIGSLRVEF